MNLPARHIIDRPPMGVATLVLIGALASSGCGDRTHRPEAGGSEDRLFVTATLPAISHIVRSILGDQIDVVTILSDPASPHGYEMRPSDARTISNSAALIAAADGVDDWVGDVAGTPKLMLFKSDVATESTRNPHGWTDPVRVRDSLSELTAFLCDVIPEDCLSFRSHSAAVSMELDSLTSALHSAFAERPPLSLVTTEPFFDPFLRRFSISVIEVLRPVPGHDPSPAALRRLLNASDRVDAIIIQSIHRDPIAVELAANQGWEVVYIDPLGLSYPDYFTYIRASADSLLTLSKN